MNEVAEGVKTTRIAHALALEYKIPTLLTRTLYKILFEEMDVREGMKLLMTYPFEEDVEYL